MWDPQASIMKLLNGRTGYLLDGAGKMGSHASSSGSCETTLLGTGLLLRKD